MRTVSRRIPLARAYPLDSTITAHGPWEGALIVEGLCSNAQSLAVFVFTLTKHCCRFDRTTPLTSTEFKQHYAYQTQNFDTSSCHH